MGCCGGRSSSRPKGMREETLVRVPGASVHLMDKADVVGLAKGDLTIVQITDGATNLAAIVRVGHDLGWPLTKDEPVVKLDKLHYLFTIPDKDGGFLNYGVSFASADPRLASLDMFLKEHACFSTPSTNASSSSSREKEKSPYEVYWKEYAPKIEGYNGVLAKAIAAGTGEIVRGIFMLSNTYTGQVQKGANMIQAQGSGSTASNGSVNRRDNADKNNDANKRSNEINKSIKRVRKLTEMTEKMSASLLDVVVSVTGSIAAPLFQSKAGKSFLSMVPGEVLLATLDAINKVMDAVEVAEKRSISATSNAVSGAVSKRFGESAGEATEDVFATAGHAVGTAWNLLKIRKAVTPSSSMPSSMLKNAVRKKTS
ncbi:hypothetical protein LUZ61_021117 [Rhynchospora tenuis]|uniref:Senescence domain-containing protein n=1 Tax=Rhynchospora tenuis TaxID=198213 RepID=A0AAD5W9S5_9POAL|nr:hypothetical protein LUZ61_021117 [Rhynchospora tenuis]